MYIWVIMRDQSNKNKYFFAMSPFKVVYLCTFISISIFLSLLWMVERVFNKQAFAHSVFFFLLPYLNVNFDDTVEGKNKLSLIQWKVTLAQMDQKRKKKEKYSISPSCDYFNNGLSTSSFSRLWEEYKKCLSSSCSLWQVIQPLVYLSKGF